MAKNVIPSDPQGLMALADNMLNANLLAAGETYELEVGMVNILTAVRGDLETKHLAVIAAEGAKELMVGEANALLAEGMDTVSRARAWLFAKLPEGRNDERLQDYLLDNPWSRSFNNALDCLQAIVAGNTAAAAAAEAWELPAALAAKVSANATDMEAKRTAVQESKGVYHEGVQTRKGTLAAIGKMVRQVRDYLYATLPQGKKDMLLKEYGLDPVD
jgi:hypothetical protein